MLMFSVQPTCQEDLRVHGMITRISHPTGAACFAPWALITAPLGGAWKGGRMVVFFQNCCPEGMFKQKKKVKLMCVRSARLTALASKTLYLFEGYPRFICQSSQHSAISLAK